MNNQSGTPTRAQSTTTLGQTDVVVTRLGLGTAPLGGWPEATDPDVAVATIEAAMTAGLRLVDTAPLYGHGLSETWIGQTLSGRPRADFTLATKVGRLLRPVPAVEPVLFKGTPPVSPVPDFTHEGIVQSLHESLERLGMDWVDIAHLHDPDDYHDEAVSVAYPALRELRDQGKIRAIGAGMTQSEMLTSFARERAFDCFLVAGRYTLLEQGALDALLPACREHHISLIAGGVYNSGVLINPSPDSYYDYAPATADMIERSRLINEVCDRHGVPVKAAALQFPLGHPAVACVVTGARNPQELEENIDAFNFSIPQDLWKDLKRSHLIRDDAPTPEDS